MSRRFCAFLLAVADLGALCYAKKVPISCCSCFPWLSRDERTAAQKSLDRALKAIDDAVDHVEIFEEAQWLRLERARRAILTARLHAYAPTVLSGERAMLTRYNSDLTGISPEQASTRSTASG